MRPERGRGTLTGARKVVLCGLMAASLTVLKMAMSPLPNIEPVSLLVMVYAMVFGAHLFPYSWLYKSKGYTVVAISIPVISLILGCTLNGTTVAAAACIIEVVFACVLHMELKKMADN